MIVHETKMTFCVLVNGAAPPLHTNTHARTHTVQWAYYTYYYYWQSTKGPHNILEDDLMSRFQVFFFFFLFFLVVDDFVAFVIYSFFLFLQLLHSIVSYFYFSFSSSSVFHLFVFLVWDAHTSGAGKTATTSTRRRRKKKYFIYYLTSLRTLHECSTRFNFSVCECCRTELDRHRHKLMLLNIECIFFGHCIVHCTFGSQVTFECLRHTPFSLSNGT